MNICEMERAKANRDNRITSAWRRMLIPLRSIRTSQAGRWAGREKVALISFGYQNIFTTSVSLDTGKLC